MKKFLLTFSIAGFTLFAFGQTGGSNSSTPAFVSGEIIVKFKSGNVTALPAGATVKKSWPQIKAQLIKLKNTMSVPQGIAFYKARKDIVYVEPNLIRTWARTVNDPLFSQQYAMPKIKANQAWDLGTGSSSTVVAVLDSGFELTHADMVGKFVAGYDFMDNDTDPTWVSEPHGVETSGCVAAATNNGVGIAAIGFDCKVMPIRVGDTGIPTANSVSGMMWAADHGAKVINMSYGGFGVSQAEKDATEYAWGKGCVLIASAGNHGTTDIAYPAGFPKVIPVAATDQNDARANFSAYGNWVTVAAPGVQVMTTQPNSSYGAADGTSFSSPITAGLAGLLFSYAQPGTTNTQIRATIESTCDPVGNFVTKGRINAFKAMQLLQVQQAPAVEVNPLTLVTVTGNPIFGDAVAASASDDIYFQTGSVMIPQFGQAAGAEATFAIPTDTQEISVKLEAVSGITGGTNMVWLWNWNSGAYELVGATPMDASGNAKKIIKVSLTDVTRFIGAGGAVKAFVRGHIPIRPFQAPVSAPFTHRIDLFQLLVR